MYSDHTQTMDSEIYGPVLLVCIYNKYGNIITHDYFYQLFSQYGEIVKILIFEKAKVWKTFIEFTDKASAKVAMSNMNNHVVFEDGSKMNIFPSKLKHIKFQNSNLGGVNYEDLKSEQQKMENDSFDGIRTRRSTLQQHTTSSVYSCAAYKKTNVDLNRSVGNGHPQDSFSFAELSDSRSNKNSVKSYNTFDIDEQFRQLARQSQQYRQLEREQQQQQFQASIRRKSKTIVNNPNMEQFVLENSPSKVLFIRSIPPIYTNKSLYNIFNNFGTVCRVIYMREKTSGLVEYDSVESAILAKDELNYAKPEIKIFYSHYDTLILRKQTQGEQFEEYKSIKTMKAQNINPPSQILYLTQAIPGHEMEIRQLCESVGCPVRQMQWKQNNKDGRWMCLVQFANIDQSLMAMGLLQGEQLQSGKEIKFSFTRSKIGKSSGKKYKHQQQNVY